MKPIFYVHNQKCGGTSFASALTKCSINYIPTSSINLETKNSSFIDSINCKPGTIIVGHPSHVKYKSSENAYQYFRHLYANYKIIFPVRNPSRVILSWVYYYNTRIQNSLNNKYGSAFAEKTPYTSLLEYDHKLLGMAAHLSYSIGDKYLNSQGFEIDNSKTTEILIEFLKYCAFHVRGTSSHSPALNFTRNLTIAIKEFNILIQNSLPISPSALEKLIENIDICIFDSDKTYATSTKHPISKYLGNHFADELTLTRKNTSRYPNGMAPSYHHKRVDSFYENLYPSEFQIFKHAQ